MIVLTEEQLEPYRRAVEERICAVCNDLGAHGGCARPADDPCALVSHLGLIVGSILEVGGSREVDPYIASIRALTCPNCRQDEAGECPLRRVAQCAADAYILPLIDVVEEVAEREGHGRFAAHAADGAAS